MERLFRRLLKNRTRKCVILNDTLSNVDEIWYMYIGALISPWRPRNWKSTSGQIQDGGRIQNWSYLNRNNPTADCTIAMTFGVWQGRIYGGDQGPWPQWPQRMVATVDYLMVIHSSTGSTLLDVMLMIYNFNDRVTSKTMTTITVRQVASCNQKFCVRRWCMNVRVMVVE